MFGLPDHPFSRIVNLSFNLGQALRIPWLQYPRSIIGDVGSLTSLHASYETELAALQPWHSRDAVATIMRAAVGSWFSPIASGPQEHPGDYEDAHPNERWFFLNGICTDLRIAHLNAELLNRAFRRPITILYNETEGLALDLIECAIGKAWDWVTKAAAGNIEALVKALTNRDVKRVILISHSQGTIVAAVLLKALEERIQAQQRRRKKQRRRKRERPGEQKASPERRAAKRVVRKVSKSLSEQDVGKLELYCFANCATSMEPFVRMTGPARLAPWIESYGNEHDLVAKLGLLAPPHGIGSARIAGDRYRALGAWGHLFNAHYALPILIEEKPLDSFHDNLRETPRLLEYLRGKSPKGYP